MEPFCWASCQTHVDVTLVSFTDVLSEFTFKHAKFSNFWMESGVVNRQDAAELCYETSLSAAASPASPLNIRDFIVFGSDCTDGTDSSDSSDEWPTGLLSHRTPLTLSPPSSSSSGHHFCPQVQRTVKPWWQLTTRGSELCPCSGERHDREDGSTVDSDRRRDAAGTELNNTGTGNCERRSTAPAAANQSIGLTSASCVLSSEKSNRCLIDSVLCVLYGSLTT